MRDLAKRVGRFGAWMGVAVTLFIVGFETWLHPRGEWLATIIITLVLVASALLAGWGAARAPRRPILAGLLLWQAVVPYGYLLLMYRNSSNAGPIHGFLLLPPLTFLWGGLFALIGKFTQPAPPSKA